MSLAERIEKLHADPRLPFFAGNVSRAEGRRLDQFMKDLIERVDGASRRPIRRHGGRRERAQRERR